MLNRLARFKIPVWTRYEVLKPKGNSYKKPELVEVGRKDVISRMYTRGDNDYVERLIIGHDDLFITFEDQKNGNYVWTIDPNYMFKQRCKMSDFATSDACKEFEEKHKMAMAFEKMSKEQEASLADEPLQQTNNLRLTVSKSDITYDCPTHMQYISIDQHCYYAVLDENNEIKLVDIEYDQLPYYNNTNSYATYINIPKERMYIVVNDADYHETEEQNWCVLFLDGKEVAPDMDKVITKEDLVKRMNTTIRDNIAKQEITPDQFLNLNDEDVEFYIDIKETESPVEE